MARRYGIGPTGRPSGRRSSVAAGGQSSRRGRITPIARIARRSRRPNRPPASWLQGRSSAGPLLDLATPRPGLLAAPRLDELLEALHVALDAVLDEAQRRTRILDRPLGVHVELERDPRLALGK